MLLNNNKFAISHFINLYLTPDHLSSLKFNCGTQSGLAEAYRPAYWLIDRIVIIYSGRVSDNNVFVFQHG